MARAARKPKPQEQQHGPVFNFGKKPDPVNGAKLYDWYARALSWPPGKAQRMLPQVAQDIRLDVNYFTKSLAKILRYDGTPPEVIPLMARDLAAYVEKVSASQTELDSAKITRPQTQKHERPVIVQEFKEHKVLVNGVPYRPVTVAAQMAQALPTTVHAWIKRNKNFGGRPLETYYKADDDRYFVSEASIERMANRFVKWPSKEPAEAVTIGATEDQSGYLGTTEAARIIGVSSRSVWLWAKKGNAPSEKPLDVVKCTTSGELYIQEKDVHDLKKLVPKTGLRRGRRPRELAFT